MFGLDKLRQTKILSIQIYQTVVCSDELLQSLFECRKWTSTALARPSLPLYPTTQTRSMPKPQTSPEQHPLMRHPWSRLWLRRSLSMNESFLSRPTIKTAFSSPLTVTTIRNHKQTFRTKKTIWLTRTSTSSYL